MSSQYYFNTNDSRSYQSTAGFNRHQPYSPSPQVRASVRVIGSQDQYPLTNSPHLVQISPQQHHFQFDSRQQSGRPTGPAVVYQTPGAAQFTHRNVDLWTEGSSPNYQPPPPQDHFVHAQRVSVRSVATGSPQQSHSVSPQRSSYYNQLPPEQTFYEQRVTTQQGPTPSFNNGGGQPAPPPPPQFYPSQQQRVEEDYQPVGIRNLMNKFDGPTPRRQVQPRSRSTSTRQYSTSGQTTTTRSYQTHSMTYSALPKPHEPPVNSVEYYQMLQQDGIPFNNLQQAIAPAHIQHAPPTAFGNLRDRFKTGSLSDDFSRSVPVHHHHQQPPPTPTHVSGGTGHSLSSIRNQYMNQTKETSHNDLPSEPVQNVSRTIIGEDYPPKQPPPPQAAPQPEPEVPAENTEAPAEPEPVDEGVSSF